MTPRIIQDSDNLVRYLGEMMFRSGELDGAAFQLRPGEEGLSVNLLDAGGGLTKAEQVAAVQRSIHLRVGRNARFAELNAGQIRQRLAAALPGLRIVHRPARPSARFPWPDSSHSEIRGLPQPDSAQYELIGDMLARCVRRLHPALA